MPQLPLEHLPSQTPSALLASHIHHPWKTNQLFWDPDPTAAPHFQSSLTLLLCPWQPCISAPEDANPISLFSCLIPRQCVPLSSLQAN